VIARARGDKSFPDLGIDSSSTRGSLPQILTQQNESLWKGFKGQWTGL
jgi:hypothetical protein